MSLFFPISVLSATKINRLMNEAERKRLALVGDEKSQRSFPLILSYTCLCANVAQGFEAFYSPE